MSRPRWAWSRPGPARRKPLRLSCAPATARRNSISAVPPTSTCSCGVTCGDMPCALHARRVIAGRQQVEREAAFRIAGSAVARAGRDVHHGDGSLRDEPPRRIEHRAANRSRGRVLRDEPRWKHQNRDESQNQKRKAAQCEHKVAPACRMKLGGTPRRALTGRTTDRNQGLYIIRPGKQAVIAGRLFHFIPGLGMRRALTSNRALVVFSISFRK